VAASAALSLTLAESFNTILALSGVHALLHCSGTALQALILASSPQSAHATHVGRLMAARGLGKVAAGGICEVCQTAFVTGVLGTVLCLLNAIVGVFLLNGQMNSSMSSRVPHWMQRRGCHKSSDLVEVETCRLAPICAATFFHSVGQYAFQTVEADFVHDAFHASSTAVKQLIDGGGVLGLSFLAVAAQWASDNFGNAGLAVVGLLGCCTTYFSLLMGLPWYCVKAALALGPSSDHMVICGLSISVGVSAPAGLFGISVALQHATASFGCLLGIATAKMGSDLLHKGLPLVISSGTVVIAAASLVQDVRRQQLAVASDRFASGTPGPSTKVST